MGSLCGKPSANFSSPGRVLGSAPPAAAATAPVPPAAAQKPRIRGQGHTLAPASPASSSAGGSGAGDARSAAAAAAEARNSKQATGKLGNRLDEQKRKTQNQHLAEIAKTKAQQEQLVWD
ncbi:hypothetical protein BZA05DRAFT_442628 [Tricharina praecox]|uniref:uncharacterized protein n=1 Tax=Tricharina praecox TaxID=43433 RepID=UPI00221FAB52|nr:uncharacterized protein BZA05DRAFT_442628 [Tricharina praecox]KAI5855956.1 hypothetical protein BZA05DRAFT_442628 [Tricharina praecox]